MAAVRAVCVMRGEGAVEGVIHFEQQVRARPGRWDRPGGCGAPAMPLSSLLAVAERAGRAQPEGAAVPNGRGPPELRCPLRQAGERGRGVTAKVRDRSGRPRQITGTPCPC